jgi:hypothetical protein
MGGACCRAQAKGTHGSGAPVTHRAVLFQFPGGLVESIPVPCTPAPAALSRLRMTLNCCLPPDVAAAATVTGAAVGPHGTVLPLWLVWLLGAAAASGRREMQAVFGLSRPVMVLTAPVASYAAGSGPASSPLLVPAVTPVFPWAWFSSATAAVAAAAGSGDVGFTSGTLGPPAPGEHPVADAAARLGDALVRALQRYGYAVIDVTANESLVKSVDDAVRIAAPLFALPDPCKEGYAGVHCCCVLCLHVRMPLRVGLTGWARGVGVGVGLGGGGGGGGGWRVAGGMRRGLGGTRRATVVTCDPHVARRHCGRVATPAARRWRRQVVGSGKFLGFSRQGFRQFIQCRTVQGGWPCAGLGPLLDTGVDPGPRPPPGGEASPAPALPPGSTTGAAAVGTFEHGAAESAIVALFSEQRAVAVACLAAIAASTLLKEGGGVEPPGRRRGCLVSLSRRMSALKCCCNQRLVAGCWPGRNGISTAPTSPPCSCLRR